MHLRSFSLLILTPTLLAASLGAGAGAAGAAPQAQPAATAPAAPPAPGWYPVRLGAWDVAPDTVERMRAQIANETWRTLDGYVVQYQGVLEEGRRMVRIAGACNGRHLTVQSVTEHFLGMLDGGTCYFDADYDAEQQRFTHFSFHGRA